MNVSFARHVRTFADLTEKEADAIKAVRGLVQRKRLDPTMMPVYRLVPRNGVFEPTEINLPKRRP
jgi:hypothetical protein